MPSETSTNVKNHKEFWQVKDESASNKLAGYATPRKAGFHGYTDRRFFSLSCIWCLRMSIAETGSRRGGDLVAHLSRSFFASVWRAERKRWSNKTCSGLQVPWFKWREIDSCRRICLAVVVAVVVIFVLMRCDLKIVDSFLNCSTFRQPNKKSSRLSYIYTFIGLGNVGFKVKKVRYLLMKQQDSVLQTLLFNEQAKNLRFV